MTAVLTLSGTGYEKLYMGTGEDALAGGEDPCIYFAEDEDGRYTYKIAWVSTSGCCFPACFPPASPPLLGRFPFMGIAVPHLVKAFLDTSRPLIVILACFLRGSIFCLGCDLIARTVFAPNKISVSAITAVLGVPIVIGILFRRRG